MRAARYRANRGSDVLFTFVWPNTEGGPLDLTGFTIDVFEADAVIAPFLQVTSPDPGNGVIQVRLDWSNTYVKNNYQFRVSLNENQDDATTNLIRIVYA
jgi:hypothetical protein